MRRFTLTVALLTLLLGLNVYLFYDDGVRTVPTAPTSRLRRETPCNMSLVDARLMGAIHNASRPYTLDGDPLRGVREAAALGRWRFNESAAVRDASDVSIFVGIVSGAANADRRDEVRQTVLAQPLFRDGGATHAFVVASPLDLPDALYEEQRRHGDLLLVRMDESWTSVTYKTLAVLYEGVSRGAMLTVKMDDDVYVDFARFLRDPLCSLRTHRDVLWAYLGKIHREAPVERRTHSKYYVPGLDATHYPPYAQGVAYGVGLYLAEALIAEDRERGLPMFPMEDVAVGSWIHAACPDARKLGVGCHHGTLSFCYANPCTVHKPANMTACPASPAGPECCRPWTEVLKEIEG